MGGAGWRSGWGVQFTAVVLHPTHCVGNWNGQMWTFFRGTLIAGGKKGRGRREWKSGWEEGWGRREWKSGQEEGWGGESGRVGGRRGGEGGSRQVGGRKGWGRREWKSVRGRNAIAVQVLLLCPTQCPARSG